MATPEQARTVAAQVAVARRMGTAGRRRRVPRSQYPTLIESDYARDLVAIIEEIRRELAPALEQVPRLLDEARRAREDAGLPPPAPLRRTHRIGLPIVIEQSAGSIRRWVDSDGTEGETRMLFDYGYLEGYVGADGEEVDVYLGPIEEPAEVYVVHQQRKSSGFVVYDEDKVMLGWGSEQAARIAYLAQYDDPRFLGGITTLPVDEFKRRLQVASGRAITATVAERLDEGEGRRARKLMDRVRERTSGAAATKAEQSAEKAGVRISLHGKAELAKQGKAALGIDLVTADRSVPAMLEHFAAENAALIKSLSTKYLDDVEKAVTRAFTEGRRAADVAKEFEERFGIAARHARLIARDQIGKLRGQITAARHQELGLTRYRWLSMDDQRVRPTHKARHGRIYTYKGEGAAPALPGQEILCRCTEEPIFDDVLAELENPTPPPAQVAQQASEASAQALAVVTEAEAIAARDRAAAAVQAAQEDLAAFAAHKEQLAAEAKLAAEKAAAEAAAAAKKAKLAAAAKKGAATKAAKKQAAAEAAQAAAKAAAEKAAAEAAASLMSPSALGEYQGKVAQLAAQANTPPPANWPTEKHQAQAAAKAALAAHPSPTNAAQLIQAAEAFEAVAAQAQAAGSYWGSAYTGLAQDLRERVAVAEIEALRATRRAARAARVTATEPIIPVRYADDPPEAFAGFHGRGYVQDADVIEGGAVRVLRVTGTDGRDYYEATFKVTAPYGAQAAKFGTRDGTGGGWAFRRRELRNGKMHDLDEQHRTANKARVRIDGDVTHEIGRDGALLNHVRIRAPSLESLDDAMGQFAGHLGVDTQREPMQLDLELQAKAKIAAKYDPKTYGALMEKAKTAEDQLDAIEIVFEAQAKRHPELRGIVADVEIVEAYPGHFTLHSKTLGRELANKFGALYHDGSPTASVAADIVGNTGLMSSARRYNSGVFTTGMSTSSDFGTGGADGVFMRLSKGVPTTSASKFRAVIDTEQVMGRLDWWAFNQDNYGAAGYGEMGGHDGYRSRFSVPAMRDAVDKGRLSSGNEVMAPHGIPPTAFTKFVCGSQSYRQEVLRELKRRRITQVNGIPVEDFVTTE